MVAATGVIVAAIYYVQNMRVTERNRKVAYTTNFMQQFYTKEIGLRYIDLVHMTWTDHDDYMKKYDSEVNEENFADRWSFFGMFDVLGYQVKNGLIDIRTIYELNWAPVLMLWIKFQPIIDAYKKTDYGEDQYADFRYLARELWRLKMERDPHWKDHAMPAIPREDFDKAFL
jgi:hypothetical protein